MHHDPAPPTGFTFGGPRLRVDLTPHAALRRIDAGDILVNLFVGNGLDGGPANLWLRRQGGGAVPLLGPRSPLAWQADGDTLQGDGRWQDLVLRVQLRVADAAWCWHVEVHNQGAACRVDVVWVQDLGLAPYGAVRLNEYYVSHYVDFTPLPHPRHGTLLAVRQNQPAAGRHPWALLGTLDRCAGWATDGRQAIGLGLRDGAEPLAASADLPSQRLQHEHAMAALQTEVLDLATGATHGCGFFALVEADHPAASSEDDLRRLAALPQARPVWRAPGGASTAAASCFTAPPLACRDACGDDLAAWCGLERRHAEHDGEGGLLSFFHGAEAHVVLPAKERRVARPHGHLLRTGVAPVPDETALTSTVWMGGVFHSMLTQGHVNVNRLLSCARSALALFPSHGLRAFVRRGGRWRLLGMPSAFEMQPGRCRWWYADEAGVLQVSSACDGDAHRMTLAFDQLQGEPCELLLSLRIALAGDDGSAPQPVAWQRDGNSLRLPMPPGSELAQRFPDGGFVLTPSAPPLAVGGDALVHDGGVGFGEPLLCLRMAPAPHMTLGIEGRLVETRPLKPAGALTWPRPEPAVPALAGLTEAMPWFLHDALIHYLAPRGLEQFSGGGWGTRDVCQGPLELLLALDAPAAARDLLQRVFSAQDAGGDWPQWFMFFERDRPVRAGDAHGDIVFWPLLALARYLVASGDAALLDEPLPYHDAPSEPLMRHVERALAVIDARRVAGTALAAYGHGDWNDSLQPADPALREHLCSAWTVTLHHQVLTMLSRALREAGRDAAASRLDGDAVRVRADFRRLLLRDGVVAGYARFDTPGAEPALLLHPSDRITGLSYSLLPLMHAVLEDLLTLEEARHHLALIRRHLGGPDGVRLFDRPLAYRGGPQRLFQRAESSSFFGREVGLMYTHAHLRWAQALAHAGDGEGLLQALDLAHPVGLRERLPMADLRQANCYYSSSDAAFADRYEAGRRYADIAAGRVALDGGWRVYSSGPGLFVAIVVRDLLGLRREARSLVLDPVLPPSLDGLAVRWAMAGLDLLVRYRVGAAGCGPVGLAWNGQPLAFATAAHRHRRGPAVVALDALRAAARPGLNELVIELA